MSFSGFPNASITPVLWIISRPSSPASRTPSRKLPGSGREPPILRQASHCTTGVVPFLRNAYRKQREQPSLWTSERVQWVFKSASKVSREDHLGWMEALPWNEQCEDTMERVPIYVRGKVWDPPGILDLLDKVGLLVVEDEITTGYRSVATDAGSDGDPMDALVRRHLSLTPYAGYHQHPETMVRGFLDRVQASGAQGVLFLNPKFCEAAGFDTPDFQRALEEIEIPSLVLETSTRGGSLEQIRVRVEAFREMIAEDLP